MFARRDEVTYHGEEFLSLGMPCMVYTEGKVALEPCEEATELREYILIKLHRKVSQIGWDTRSEGEGVSSEPLLPR